MKQEIAQKNNEIERIKLIKVTDDETGKVSYEVLNRDKIHMEEEVFKYKRVDFAVKRYLHISCEYTPVNDLVEMCRNCVQETKAVSTCPVCGGAVEDEEMAAHLISQHSVPSGNAEDYEEYLIGRNGQIGISGKTVEMYEDEIEKMRAILSAAYGGPKEEQNEDEHEEEGDETNMKIISKDHIEEGKKIAERCTAQQIEEDLNYWKSRSYVDSKGVSTFVERCTVAADIKAAQKSRESSNFGDWFISEYEGDEIESAYMNMVESNVGV